MNINKTFIFLTATLLTTVMTLSCELLAMHREEGGPAVAKAGEEAEHVFKCPDTLSEVQPEEDVPYKNAIGGRACSLTNLPHGAFVKTVKMCSAHGPLPKLVTTIPPMFYPDDGNGSAALTCVYGSPAEPTRISVFFPKTHFKDVELVPGTQSVKYKDAYHHSQASKTQEL